MIRPRMLKGATVLVLGTAVAACTWVDLKPQGEKVRRLAPQEVSKCRFIGKITANTAARIGIIARGQDSVQEEVNRLARNNAGEMDGDTIVPTGPLIDGEQSFNVYRCINP